MSLPKTIPIPVEELQRAQDLAAIKRVLHRFFLEVRSTYERVQQAIEMKVDK